MKTERNYSYFLVTSQFLFIGLLLLNSKIFNNYFYFFVSFWGIVLGLWAVFVMKKSKLSIIPDVSKNASLVEDGPYKFIRHPMYSSVLIFSLGLLFSNLNMFTFMFYLFLLTTLYLKMNYEEKLLEKSFVEYKKYLLKTKRLIPFLY